MPRLRDNVWVIVSAAMFVYILFSHTSTVLPASYSSSSKLPKAGPLDLTGRIARSEKIFQESVRKRQQVRSEYKDPNNIPLFAAQDKQTYHDTPYSAWDMVPASFNCPWDVQRVGRLGDGGKWICGMTRYEENTQKECIIYSFGVRDESSFEVEMLERTNCKVFAFDFSVSEFGPQLDKKKWGNRANFFKVGLAGKTDETQDPPFYTLKDLMVKNGHNYIDILKMDIEYYEFESLDSFRKDTEGVELSIGQFLVEIHLLSERRTPGGQKPLDTAGFLKWWEALEQRGLRPVWTEPNLLYVTQKLDDAMPRLAEYTFINVKDSKSLLLEE